VVGSNQRTRESDRVDAGEEKEKEKEKERGAGCCCCC